ncbi:hypothetical protein VTN49DRAFT_3749 [Thermomyces lanuginosus]|uniref:uncharacterized protein n=1 Tax=Thermomyces lanuginosus TaxID=5541 RepID=UPI0037421572
MLTRQYDLFDLPANTSINLSQQINHISVTPAHMENGAAAEGKDPSSFLSEILGAPVTVKLNSGVVYKGKTAFSSGVRKVRLL